VLRADGFLLAEVGPAGKLPESQDRRPAGIRRGTFASVAELEEAIHDYLLRHNAEPKPFVWTKNAESILKRERRALDLLDLIRKGNQPSESEH
jgi:hypothetical protein